MKKLAITLLFVTCISSLGRAQGAAPAAAAASPTFDAAAATQAYLDRMTPDQKKRSDSYFVGGYWLLLWDFLVTAGISLLLLGLGISGKFRDLAERLFKAKPLQTGAYWVLYLLATSILAFPMTVYEQYFREHQYGLATQTFGPWLGDQAKALGLNLVLGGLGIIVLYGVLRRTPKTWWLWGSLTAIALLVFAVLIGPVFLNPIFNKYTTVTDPAIREPILRLARENGIPATDVYEFDASKQTTRMSANVSGIFGTTRISLNDNLLKRAKLPEVEAVMGHEMGHYVLNHVYKGILELGLVIVIGFAAVKFGFERITTRAGGAWGIRGVGDVAGLPLLVLLIVAYFFVATPVTNTIIRTQEIEADMFGLNSARQPEGFAEAALHLAEYRKMNPGPFEEFFFFDHPSGRNRIFAAMRWKAENLK